MPIHSSTPIARLTREEFLIRDEIVMRCAYATQNRLGRLCDERVYENDLAARLRAEGMGNLKTQVSFTVSHETFAKEYRLDLVADDAVYELKTVLHLIGEHDAQVLNYAMLRDLLCIKLLNFRNAKVEGKLRLSGVTNAERHAFTMDETRWQPLSPRCHELKRQWTSLVSDVGAFLDTRLYEEALAFLLSAHPSRLTVTRDGLELGTHSTLLLTDQIAFCITAFTTAIGHQQSHLARLLGLLPLTGLQWINLNHADISLVTLVK